MFGLGDIVVRVGSGRRSMVVDTEGRCVTVAWKLASGETRERMVLASSLVLIRRPTDASRGAPRAR